MIRSLAVTFAVVSACAAPPHLAAQLGGVLGAISLTAEAAPVLAVGLGDFGTADPGPAAGLGYGVEAGLSIGLAGGLAVYGDYQYLRFACGECEEFGLDPEMLDVGFEGGARLTLPLQLAGARPWARAGVVVHQLQFTDDTAAQVSDPGIGVGLGAGADLPLTGALWISPSVRFRSYPAAFDFSEFADRTTDVMYALATLGISYRF